MRSNKERAMYFLGNEPLRWEVFVVGVFLLLVNLSLVNGRPAVNLAYQEAAVRAGEWWRLFTFPFVHVSLYNLLLDGIAFIMLYLGLEEESALRRLSYVVFSIAGSLIFPLLTSAQIEKTGLCGLSGCAHGLMAISGLELIRRHSKGDALYKTGILTISVILVKSTIEAVTGDVIFSWFHFGDIGTPVAESHLGGALGGILAFILLKNGGKRR